MKGIQLNVDKSGCAEYMPDYNVVIYQLVFVKYTNFFFSNLANRLRVLCL